MRPSGLRRGGARRAAVRLAALVTAGVWSWTAYRLGTGPAGAGPVEALAAAGWGLSLLPVHCVPWTRPRGRRRGTR
ncbi:hypothetical protein I5Q34_31315 [Streptomyces sp. AV19]|nr:hypothetical protein [Streptomyces sp. AV19]